MMSFQNQSQVRPEDRYEIVNLVETKMLYLSTKSSQCTLLNGDMKSWVSYDLKSYLDFTGDDTIQSVSIALVNAILCNSNYQVNQNNNILAVNLNGTLYNYAFQYGNYSVDSFIAEFKSIADPTFTLTYDSVSLRFTLTNSTWPFTLVSATSSIDAIMGFSTDLASTQVSAPYSVTCTRLMNFLPTPCFRILCDNNNLYWGTILGANGSPSYSNVLAHIPNNSQPNQLIYYQTFSDEFSVNSSGQTQLILRIVDDNGNLVDFNGVSSYFSFRIKVYKKVRRLKESFMDLLSHATNLRTIQEEGTESVEIPLSTIL